MRVATRVQHCATAASRTTWQRHQTRSAVKRPPSHATRIHVSIPCCHPCHRGLKNGTRHHRIWTIASSVSSVASRAALGYRAAAPASYWPRWWRTGHGRHAEPRPPAEPQNQGVRRRRHERLPSVGRERCPDQCERPTQRRPFEQSPSAAHLGCVESTTAWPVRRSPSASSLLRGARPQE